MTILRSPSYPGMSLRQAVVLADKLFNSNRTNPVDREAAAKDMGFAGLTGSSTKAMADLTHFGLIEKAGKGGIRITPRAVQILHGEANERSSALHEAASSPTLFSNLRAHFADGIPSANALKSYLLRQNFVDAAIPMAMNSYLETSRYLQEATVNESHGGGDRSGAESAPSEVDEGKRLTSISGGARVGDLIQWEAAGALQFDAPRRVRLVSDDGQWVVVDNSETGIPMSEVTVEQREVAPQAPPPFFPLSQQTAQKPSPSGDQWLQMRVGPETKVTISVSGEMGPKEIGKLIKLLEIQKTVLMDIDDL